jgi:hypothetical protein
MVPPLSIFPISNPYPSTVLSMFLSCQSLIRIVISRCCLPVILLLIGGNQTPAADWPDIREVGPFICRADFPLQGLQPFLNQLAQLQNDLVDALNIPPAREVIEVYLFHDKPTYERYLTQHYPNVPFRRAVYIKGNGLGRVFAYRSDQFEIDLRHECTHALLHASLKNIPLWLDEGLAGYFELAPNDRAFDNPHLNSVRWNVWLGIVPNLENMEKCTDVAKMGKAEYRDSWAWVHFMLHSQTPAHFELVSFLHDLQGSNPPDPLSRRLQTHVPSLPQSFITHFKKWKKEEVARW